MAEPTNTQRPGEISEEMLWRYLDRELPAREIVAIDTRLRENAASRQLCENLARESRLYRAALGGESLESSPSGRAGSSGRDLGASAPEESFASRFDSDAVGSGASEAPSRRAGGRSADSRDLTDDAAARAELEAGAGLGVAGVGGRAATGPQFGAAFVERFRERLRQHERAGVDGASSEGASSEGASSEGAGSEGAASEWERAGSDGADRAGEPGSVPGAFGSESSVSAPDRDAGRRSSGSLRPVTGRARVRSRSARVPSSSGTSSFGRFFGSRARRWALAALILVVPALSVLVLSMLPADVETLGSFWMEREWSLVRVEGGDAFRTVSGAQSFPLRPGTVFDVPQNGILDLRLERGARDVESRSLGRLVGRLRVQGPARFTVPSSATSTNFTGRLDVGEVSVEVEPRRPGESFALETPDARARVLGTRFSVAVLDDETRLWVDHGTVEFGAIEAESVTAEDGAAPKEPRVTASEERSSPERSSQGSSSTSTASGRAAVVRVGAGFGYRIRARRGAVPEPISAGSLSSSSTGAASRSSSAGVVDAADGPASESSEGEVPEDSDVIRPSLDPEESDAESSPPARSTSRPVDLNLDNPVSVPPKTSDPLEESIGTGVDGSSSADGDGKR
jgi:hypothetical protein